MATTFKRVEILLNNASTNDTWENSEKLAKFIRNEKIIEFQTKKGDIKDLENYMKLKTIERLINLSVELELIEKINKDQLKLTRKGTKAIQSDENYKRQIKSSVKSLLIAKGAPLTDIIAASKEIKLPDVPDVSTIHKKLPDHIKISEKELRSILFLYALADGIQRKTRVMYQTQ